MEKINDKIRALPDNAPFISLEFFPPKTQAGFSNLSARLERMSRALRPLFVSVTWGAGGSTATKSLELAELCQRQLGLTTCLHLTCTNMSRKVIDKTLEQAKELGVRNILALRGDLPREEEYGLLDELEADKEQDAEKFVWAVDLVRYIKKNYGEYFCIGVTAYPDGHSDQSHVVNQAPENDLPYLIEKVKAGADLIFTQFFFNTDQYFKFESLVQNEPTGLLKDMPVIPGLMPIQSYKNIKRITKLSHVKMPLDITKAIDDHKDNDEEVKKVGVKIITDLIHRLQTRGKRGFHFYTLNLEKSVSQIVEQCDLIRGLESPDSECNDDLLLLPEKKSFERRRLSSGPQNRLVVEKVSLARNKDYEALESEVGLPEKTSRKDALAISEGEGSLGRELASWDDFINGRFGDARSPAFGEIDAYGVSLHMSIPEALKLWGYPTTVQDISVIFKRHINGDLNAIPWSEEHVSPETATIKEQLLDLNSKGWWTVASQPAVNGAPSTHPIFGWGPKNGFVFQKPFVEFFMPDADWKSLRERLNKHPEVTYLAARATTKQIEQSEIESVNAVTWGAFTGKEIITPTIIEPESFKAWKEEAFSIWREWQRIYHPRSASAELLKTVGEGYWLVNLVHHEYMEPSALWNLLLEQDSLS